MIKFSKKISFSLFALSSLVLGLFVTRDINEYNPDGGSFFYQFESSFLSLSLTISMMYYYLKALKEEKKKKQEE